VIRDSIVAPALSMVPAGVLDIMFKYPAYLGQRGKRKALDYLRLLEPSQIEQAYCHLISLFDGRDTQDLYSPDFRDQLEHASGPSGGQRSNGASSREPYLNRLIGLQFRHWLPDNMLLRQDKTGMANAIEGRVPFLDHELVEFGMRLPPHLKLRRLAGKYILRRYAAKLLPREVAQRKKMPFYVPIENYFQQSGFRDLMDDLLNETAVKRRGLFRPQAVENLRRLMHQREFLLVKQVFSLMVLELWFRLFYDRMGSVSMPACSPVSWCGQNGSTPHPKDAGCVTVIKPGTAT
jgi:asparagine synthase (glutamine-hydrolysing)